MSDALDDCGVDGVLRERLAEAFHRTADWMRNRPD
jgi:truncated hemoglobin YjbI